MKSISIGRDPESQFSVQDTEVSWKHCVLHERSDGRVDLEDLGSTNGTFVNGQKKSSVMIPLYPGDLVQVGNTKLDWELLLGRGRGTVPALSRGTVRANPMARPAAPADHGNRDVHVHLDPKGKQNGMEKFETGAKGVLQLAKAAFYVALAILFFWFVLKVLHVFG